MNLRSKFHFISGCLLFALISLSHSYPNQQAWDINYELAKSGDEFMTLIADQNANIIRSRADFYKYVNADPQLKKVFRKGNLVGKFAARMKFSQGGLQTLHYGDLKTAYPMNYKAVLRRLAPGFGLTPDAMAETSQDDYYCAASGVCKADSNSLCFSINC